MAAPPSSVFFTLVAGRGGGGASLAAFAGREAARGAGGRGCAGVDETDTGVHGATRGVGGVDRGISAGVGRASTGAADGGSVEAAESSDTDADGNPAGPSDVASSTSTLDAMSRSPSTSYATRTKRPRWRSPKPPSLPLTKILVSGVITTGTEKSPSHPEETNTTFDCSSLCFTAPSTPPASVWTRSTTTTTSVTARRPTNTPWATRHTRIVSATAAQFPRARLIASDTGLLLPGVVVVCAAGAGPLPSAFRTQSYWSQPRSGNSRSTAFHFG